MSISNMKQTAKKVLKGNWGIAIGIFALYTIVATILQSLSEDHYFVNLIFTYLVLGPLSIGYSWFHLDLKRGNPLSVKSLLAAFNHNYLKYVGANFLITIFTLLWTILLIIPGIIKGLAYSQTLFLLRDNPTLKPLEAITESRRVMNGKKMELFLLILSFFGWVLIPLGLIIFALISIAFDSFSGVIGASLLGIFSFFAIALYLAPYYMTTLATFYDENIYPLSLDRFDQE